MSDEIKLVYEGSRTEGLFIKEMLDESNIKMMFRDVFQSSIQAGWADGLPEDRIKIFVDTTNFEEARNLLEEYFTTRDSK